MKKKKFQCYGASSIIYGLGEEEKDRLILPGSVDNLNKLL